MEFHDININYHSSATACKFQHLRGQITPTEFKTVSISVMRLLGILGLQVCDHADLFVRSKVCFFFVSIRWNEMGNGRNFYALEEAAGWIVEARTKMDGNSDWSGWGRSRLWKEWIHKLYRTFQKFYRSFQKFCKRGLAVGG